MSISFFEDLQQSSGSIDFAIDYLKNNPKMNGTSHQIISVKLVTSGKGYLFSTDQFICWMWRKDKTAIKILEALDFYVENRYGYALMAVLDKSQKDGFRIGVDSDKPCTYWGKEGRYGLTTDTLCSSAQVSENPFLLPVPLPPITMQQPQKEQTPSNNNGKTTSKSQKPLED